MNKLLSSSSYILYGSGFELVPYDSLNICPNIRDNKYLNASAKKAITFQH